MQLKKSKNQDDQRNEWGFESNKRCLMILKKEKLELIFSCLSRLVVFWEPQSVWPPLQEKKKKGKSSLTHDMFVSQSNKWSFVEASAQFSANKNNIKNQYFFGVSICFCSNLLCSSLVLSASCLVQLWEIRNAQKRRGFFPRSLSLFLSCLWQM